MNLRSLLLISLTLVGALLYTKPLIELVRFSSDHQHYSHIVLIPFVSAFFFITNRRTIFVQRAYSSNWGIGILLVSALLFWFGSIHVGELNQNDYLSEVTSSFVLFLLGGFILCFGMESFRKAAFPLLFLLFMIPVPTLLLSGIIQFLQRGSAEVASVLFQLTTLPVFRDGFSFVLPGVSIEVAEECSGIRSSIALLITGVIVSHILLKTTWRRVLAVLAVIPLAILKNGIRIVSLTLLSIYVDPGFLRGDLHRRGGVVFFLITLCLYAPFLLLLHRSENPEWKGRIKLPFLGLRRGTGPDVGVTSSE